MIVDQQQPETTLLSGTTVSEEVGEGPEEENSVILNTGIIKKLYLSQKVQFPTARLGNFLILS